MNLLAPIGKLYGRVIDARNKLYDKGHFRSHSLGAKTISIGNLTTGGTGKTPIVQVVTEILAGQGERVCILTRGYGRTTPNMRVLVTDGHTILVDASTGGDEPVELAGALLGKAIIVADPDRIAAAAWVKQNFDVSVFVLDDGFQHRKAKRDIDIVCIDATNPCGNGRMLPVGKLRESFKGLKRADAIIITRANLVNDITDLAARLRLRNTTAPIFHSQTKITNMVAFDDHIYRKGGAGKVVDVQKAWLGLFNGADRVLFAAFCGLGNPTAFFQQITALLEKDKASLEWTRSFTDHFEYRQQDIDALAKKAMETGVSAFITTAKDAVKLAGLKFRIPCYVALSQATIEPMEEFSQLILARSSQD